MKSLDLKKKETAEGVEFIPQHITRVTWAKVIAGRPRKERRVVVTLKYPDLLIMRAYKTKVQHTVKIEDVWKMAEARQFNEAMKQIRDKQREKQKKQRARIRKMVKRKSRAR